MNGIIGSSHASMYPEVQNTDPHMTEQQSAARPLIHAIYIPACLTAVTLYVSSIYFYGDPSVADLKYVQFDASGNIASFDNDEDFKFLSALCCAAFVMSAFRTFVSIYFHGASHRPVLFCTILINLTAAHTHYTMSRGELPVYDTCFGRKFYSARAAEWTSMVSFLMVLMNSLDCRSYGELMWSTGLQTISVICAFSSTLACKWGLGHGGVDHHAENMEALSRASWWTPAGYAGQPACFRIALFLLVVSCVLFCDIYRVVRNRIRATTSASDVPASQAYYLTVWVTTSWTILVIVFCIGVFNPSWFDNFSEQAFYSVVDLLAKCIYTDALSEAHLLVGASLEAYRSQLAIKERVNGAQRHFLRYVFHEVRVPLNTIRLGIDSFQEGHQSKRHVLDDDTIEVIECLDSAVSAMSHTLNDVLSYQKIEEGKFEVCLAPFEAEQMLRDVVFSFQNSTRAKELTTKIVLDQAVPTMLIGDYVRIRQVLSNLISNAIKFSENGNAISVKMELLCWQDDIVGDSAKSREVGRIAEVQFSVVDNGIGIAQEDQCKLFQPFSQVRAGDLKEERGSGLGLCICFHMVSLMGGTIGVRSNFGEGSNFFFSVPLALTDNYEVESNNPQNNPQRSKSVVEEYQPNQSMASLVSKNRSYSPTTLRDARLRESPVPPAPQQPMPSIVPPAIPSDAAETKLADGKNGKTSQVLVVDDVKSNRKLLARCMKQLGFVCDEAEDGSKAVAMASSNHYQLILMDNVMPVMNGVAATKEIRRLQLAVRIIGVTGNALQEDLAEFVNAGCDEVMTKPFDMKAFKKLCGKFDIVLAA